MISKYFSEWTQQIFVIWLVGYLLGIKVITKYINPWYASILSLVGFFLLVIYLTCNKQYKFELSFLVTIFLLHCIPLYISHKYKTNNYSKENLIIMLIAYLLFLSIIQKNPLDIYLKDKHPSSWKDLTKLCRSNNKHLIPLCFIYNLI
jgi:hypothetical protein